MAQQATEIVFTLADIAQAQAVSGKGDENLRWLENQYGIRVIPRGIDLILSGDTESVEKVRQILENVAGLDRELTAHDFHYASELINTGNGVSLRELNSETIVTTARGRQLYPKTQGQREYVQTINSNVITFGIGPAGTGKTFLAMAVAAAALKKKEVSRIILTRPAVEAGEHLGFLPGDLQNKVDPYLRPLYDALYEILGQEQYLKLREKGVIEIAPLAYMRGRTLDDSFIILDEAQNTTNEQMKMFLTRLGYGSKAVVTGDVTQIDLPRGKKSGLVIAGRILKNVKGIGFCYLTESDVVRHPLVQRVIKAYAEFESEQQDEA
ncbi:MAG: PhoH family protein [Limnochordia bacterium]|nr:PhoH family protein [Bacillota bacterium]HOB08671.1 PhoH family protein [Limnochordia bacterium]HPT92662.1 PhoH family protein [Limnochordia bacterium]HPZ30969.1 PhoH family protein [Limnochordia bacterium]HQD70805.1 PhoH family protein [Limnochordia bacterium]